MMQVDAKTAVLLDKLQMVGCNCPAPAIKAIVTEVYALFAAQVPTGDPSPSQQADMMDTLANPGLLHREQLREIVARHVPLFHRMKVISACVDLGRTLTLDDCFQAMREGRQTPATPAAKGTF